ncbi:MAG: HEAT repeat domain-containing protein [Limisphaerales bacterium]
MAQLDKSADSRHPATLEALTSLGARAAPELRRRLIARNTPTHQILNRIVGLGPNGDRPRNRLEERRRSAAEAVEVLGFDASQLAPELAQGFRLASDPDTREAIRRAWVRLGAGSLPSILVLALDPDPGIRARSIPTLVRLLSDPAIQLPFARSDLAVLLASQLVAPEVPVVLGATHVLDCLAKDAESARPALTRNLSHPDPAIRVATAAALGRIGPGPSPDDATRALARGLGDPVDDVQAASARALAAWGAAAAGAVPDLVHSLAGSADPGSLAAIHALGRIGPEAGAAVPDLAKWLVRGTDRPIFRSSAATALGRIARDPDIAVPALVRGLEDSDEEVRQCAIRAIARFGPRAAPAVEALRRALVDSAESVRILAAESLAAIGPEARGAIPSLLAARNNNPSVMSGPVGMAVARIESSLTETPGPIPDESEASPWEPFRTKPGR